MRKNHLFAADRIKDKRNGTCTRYHMLFCGVYTCYSIFRAISLKEKPKGENGV